MNREVFTAADGKAISLAVWEVDKPIGVVQIAHGMAEHIARYDRFARALNQRGFTVVGSDHRAHGLTDRDGLGKVAGDCFEDTVGDLKGITAWANEKYGLPIVLFGHSYGSFLTQRYLQGENSLSGAVLCGSAFMKGVAVSLGCAVASSKVKKGKGDEGGKFLAKVTFESYGKKFEGGNSWLSTDKSEVKKYDEDELSGFLCSYGFYNSFFEGLKEIAKNSPLDRNIKLLLVAGEDDPVGAFGKSVKALYNRYSKVNPDTVIKLFPKLRHEILNENGKEDVIEYIADFICSCV